LFEATETTNQALAKNLNEFLDFYNLRKKIIAYVKDEGANFNAMTRALKIVFNYDILALEESFNGTCFGHVFSKTCQYATTKEKVCKNFKFFSIKSMQSNIQKCVTWPKKSRKGRQEWSKACIDARIRPRELNILLKSR
jgi:hypothetical protein